jgi:5-(carboxyamino)imidazole ribonucleotide mutase
MKPDIGIVMGSDSDWSMVKETVDILDRFGVPNEVRVISAHRSPDAAADYAKTAAKRGLKVIIAAAGGAAHLAGVIAAHTVLPVIAIPVKGGALNGVDALLAMVQMPAGIPVATVTLGSAGPVNAAVLAVQILAVARPPLARKLATYKVSLRSKVEQADARIREEVSKRS